MSNVSTITTPTQQFRLSFWHSEIAKLIGEGLPNREIMKRVKITGPRLSVLRANPLIKREAARYKQMHEDKYRKALEVFADSAVEMAHQTTALAKNPLMPGQVRLAAIQVALDHAEKLSPLAGQSKSASGGEESFEMLLRMTRRQAGELDASPQPAEFDPQRTEAELLTDGELDDLDAFDLSDALCVNDYDNSPPQSTSQDGLAPMSVAASSTPPSGGELSPIPVPVRAMSAESEMVRNLISKLAV